MRSLSHRLPCFPLLAAPAALALLLGCGGYDGPSPPGEGGYGGWGGYGGSAACEVPATCNAELECLASTSNAARNELGFRIAQLSITTPTSLRDGFWSVIGENLFGPNIPACDVLHAGTTSWLLHIDAEAGTLRTGVAAPTEEGVTPAAYSFYDATITLAGQPRHIAPLTLDVVQDAHGLLQSATTGDLDIQLFWPSSLAVSTPGDPTVFPLRSVAIHDLFISSSWNCIGQYTPEAVTVEEGCSVGPVFTPGGVIEAYISLEEADALDVNLIDLSLCALLSGDVSTWGDGATPVKHCRRTNGVIDFPGDWCAATNSAATADCHDALRFRAEIAASAAPIAD